MQDTGYMARTCRQCGSKLPATHQWSAVYCNRRCGQLYRRRQVIAARQLDRLPCPHCGDPLTERRGSVVFCDDSCRVAYKYAQDPERKRAIRRAFYARHSARLKVERDQRDEDTRERERAAGRRCYANHREARVEFARLTRLADIATALARERASRERHKTAINARQRDKREADPETARRYRMLYDARHPNGKQARSRPLNRFRIWFLSAGRCGICGDLVAFDAMHADHIVPLARGGEHSYANTQAAHPRCNMSKGARMP
jgi:5-methylcytosine-specific restriction endonuclease McrA